MSYPSEAEWHAVLEARRDKDPLARSFFADLVRETGLSRSVVDRAWESGNPDLGLQPVKFWPFRDSVEARAARADVAGSFPLPAEKARMSADDKALQDALRTRAEESDLVHHARTGAIQMLRQINELIDGWNVVVSRAHERVIEFATNTLCDDSREFGLDEIERIAQILWRLSASHKNTTQGAEAILKIERLLMGEPGEIIGFNSDGVPAAREALAERLKEKLDALQRDRARREGDQ